MVRAEKREAERILNEQIASVADLQNVASHALVLEGDQQPVHGGPGEPGAPVSIGMLESASNYDERVGMVRGFTRDNPARAALAVRDMIKADAK